MSVYLGVDIGTYESKGVLVDGHGAVLKSASRPHGLIVPQAGWAEHRAEEDWWADFVWLARKLIDESGLPPSEIKGIGTSAIGPCMLPVDADGAPLMNAVLYGVDTRASREIEDLTASIGAEMIFARCGNALTSQSVGPKNSLAQAQPAGHLRPRSQVPQFDLVPRSPPDRPIRHGPLHCGQHEFLSISSTSRAGARLSRPKSRNSIGSRNSPGPRTLQAASLRAPLSKPASCRGRQLLSARSTRRPRQPASAFSTQAT